MSHLSKTTSIPTAEAVEDSVILRITYLSKHLGSLVDHVTHPQFTDGVWGSIRDLGWEFFDYALSFDVVDTSLFDT